MAIKSLKELKDKAFNGGQNHRGFFRKTAGSVAQSGGLFYDFSMYPGSPGANYYASTPLVSATLGQSEGINLGNNQDAATKYLKSILAYAVTPFNIMFLDYLLYYPFIDGDSTDDQPLTNTVSLPRYTDGKNVKAFLVSQGNYTGAADFYITYTNQDGVSGRLSRLSRTNTWGSFSCLINSGNITDGVIGPFVQLAQGDTGIRSVESIKLEQVNGGIFAIVLVAELGNFNMTTGIGNPPTEKDFLIDQGFSMPVIQNGAVVNFIAASNTNFNSQPVIGNIQTIWG